MSSARRLIIGTRGSRLALRQAGIVRDALLAAEPSLTIDLLEIKTEGDVSKAPLSEIGGAGVFTGAIEEALLGGRVDLAVHSLKDLPPRDAPGLVIAAVPPRADARDALVTARGEALAALPVGARIGTGSARRAVQLLQLRPDVMPVDVRGNVDTRIAKVDAGDYDAVVLACAGLDRLGLRDRAAEVFSVDKMVPAPGQGCLAVQVRAGDAAQAVVERIDHQPSRAAADCERAFLARLGAGCRLPVGAFAELDDAVLRARAMLAADGEILRVEERGSPSDARALGTLLAETLIARAGPAFVSADA